MKKISIIVLIIFITVIATAVVFYSKSIIKNTKPSYLQQDTQNEVTKLKSFRSVDLDFSVKIPQEYEVDEGLTYVDFIKRENSIGMSRTAHTYTSLSDFLLWVDEKNNLINTKVIKDLEINGYSAKVRDEIRGGTEVRQYYVFTDSWVYVFSTNIEALYDDLDQIAQSFRYTP